MTISNLFITSLELLFGFFLVFLFLIQDRLVLWEKKAARQLRLSLRRARRRFRRFLRLQRAKRLDSFHRICLYRPIGSSPTLPDRAA